MYVTLHYLAYHIIVVFLSINQLLNVEIVLMDTIRMLLQSRPEHSYQFGFETYDSIRDYCIRIDLTGE